MIKISVFLEDKSGKAIGEAHSQKEKITIGSSEFCSVKINDNKVSPIESEVYSVSGECWIQVAKEGAPITFKNKQYRTLKIEKNSELQFRNYKLKVMIESAVDHAVASEGFDLSVDSTKFVNESTKLVLDESTRILKKESDDTAEKTRIVSNNEATRVVSLNEATRVVPINEATRIVESNEATRVVNLEKEDTIAHVNFDENKTRIVSPYEQKKESRSKSEDEDFFFNSSPKKEHINRINLPPEFVKYLDDHLKEVLFFALAGFICIYIGKTVLFDAKPKKVNLEQVAENQIQKFQKDSSNIRNDSEVDKLKHVEKTVQAVSREVYLRELSGLFDRN